MQHPIPLNFWRNHLVIPLVIFSILAIYIELSGVDALLTDKIYAWEGGSWTLKNAWITKALIHEAGKYFSLAVALLVIFAVIATYLTPRFLRHQRELLFLLCAAAGSSGLISILKGISHVSCPWDFARYGGELPYASVFSQIIHSSGGGCFPAGHASGGYAWLALYFLGMHKQAKWRWAGLGFALGVGIIFGVSQQLRGAHFITHDLWTLGLCWFFSLFMYKLMLLGKSPSRVE